MFQIRRDATRTRVSGIPQRIEELGRLNDEFLRLLKLSDTDPDGWRDLAQEYEARGMRATAKSVLREGGLG
jgi:hypothetical protein